MYMENLSILFLKYRNLKLERALENAKWSWKLKEWHSKNMDVLKNCIFFNKVFGNLSAQFI